ncbi:MAG: aldehyde dehydrogenase [Balneola sp.]|jgi:acyl-CoA reductase-like NAD-dependent aldehyde dehydrogenase|nr:aldehyde dehydrogenase [Balneola sp.]MBE79298.1 aldehyde dehydrogenase [Balneola sp.]HBX66845.1 aldehyde dehydrogenase [Balneolaceae bacterium]|tara:strand:- start:722 stop:1591 length:870 start_codon:yes stop_codon:yes gene_type:complete
MSDQRIDVKKTYKMYVGGNFPRSESGRTYKVFDSDKNLIANVCQGSRKDFRDAVRIARGAFGGWSSRSAYNRGQILYRIAEMLEDRRDQFMRELGPIGFKTAEAEADINASIDRLIYYAGWADKYQQVFGSINPVASSHFNFSMLEPTGVVAAFAPEKSPLLGLVSTIAPIIVGGNTCIILASEDYPLPAMSFAEVLNSSDVPGGVVNILSGKREELAEHFSTHMDVNAMLYTDKLPKEMKKLIDENASLNVKRIIKKPIEDWYSEEAQSPYLLTDFQETKTTWHPVGF